ncbi:putative autotransporter protein [Rhodovulum sp. P5]|uniref:VPLPA-CTERM sorting domain-containing protein n=1 Tax=Rhodovulum sp. P5 TaxID=1564506 RepID=UPI0009C380F9|nr:VPLPA-CTERM sorting domain-containing protein [Rhodovulum sp. P5]ARE39118.1 putative autotransporter protein [Rhodovulum sp. P5]
MKKSIAAAALAIGVASSAQAVEVNWIDWTGSDNTNGFTAYGTITSDGETIDVVYNNPQGVGFIQTGTGANYFGYSGDSPYTSEGPNGNSNDPTPAEMIALRYAGTQTLTFSQTVQNLYYSYVSMNGNGYRYSQDFEILSNTGQNWDGTGNDGRGYFGSGPVVRVDNNDGTYSLNAISGEPHGTILFTDTFDTLTWQSLTNEYWNGFTIGVEGTDAQVPDPVPLPAAAFLLIGGLGSLAALGTRRTS